MFGADYVIIVPLSNVFFFNSFYNGEFCNSVEVMFVWVEMFYKC